MRNFKVKAIACVVLIMLVLLSSFQQLKLDDMRNDLGINDTQNIKDTSPSVVFTTIALGSFRGFIANLLFLRSNRLQEERRYYEVHQLAKWIRNLQPKFTAAISFMAWNMSYNISVTFDTPEERWVWVEKGMQLYRDAIKNHSGDSELYREYGWIFQHKMGMNLDDANRYYKQRWALLMIHLLKEDLDLQKIAEVTRNPDILHNKLANMGFPEFVQLLKFYRMSYEDLVTHVLNDEKNELPDKIKAKLKEEKWQKEIVKFILQCERRRFEAETLEYLMEGFIDLDKTFDSIGTDWDFAKLEELFRELGRLPQEFSRAVVMAPREKAELLGVVDSFLRDRWAMKEYLLDVRKMWKITEEYGNLDWRIAETHAIYWARIGLEKEPGSVKCRRMVTQALKDVVDRGKLLYFSSETHESIDWTYNVDLVDNVSKIIEQNIAELDEKRRGTFETGYENFLKDCVHALYMGGRKKRAKFYAKKLIDRFPGNVAYKDLEKIIQKEVLEDLTSMNEDQARGIFEQQIRQAFQQNCLYENEEFAVFYWRQAKAIYNFVRRKHKNRKGRSGFNRSFYEMSEVVFQQFKIKFPGQKLQAQSFFSSMTAEEPKTLPKKDKPPGSIKP